jgi:hypothetical protein
VGDLSQADIYVYKATWFKIGFISILSIAIMVGVVLYKRK